MQGGYQLLDFGNLTLIIGNMQNIRVPFNLRDYVGKQIRISGLIIRSSATGDVLIGADSVMTFNTISVNGNVRLSTVIVDGIGDTAFIDIEQLEDNDDFIASFNYYVY